jgi:hypothetical protein
MESLYLSDVPNNEPDVTLPVPAEPIIDNDDDDDNDTGDDNDIDFGDDDDDNDEDDSN